MNKRSRALARLTATALAMSTIMLTHAAQAETSGYNQITFDTQASQTVENDEVYATLYQKIQADTPKLLATKLNRTLNAALKTAKLYPSVTATSGSQNTYPLYDDDRKIIGWTGNASVNLKSDDFAATSELVAALQNDMVIENITFGISQQKRDEIESKLMQQASTNFQHEASTLTKTWQASSYRVIAVTLNSRGNFGGYPMPVMASRSMESSVPAQSFEGGNTEMSVTANGTIELVK